MQRRSLKLLSVIIFMFCAAPLVISCASPAGQTLTQAVVNFLDSHNYQEDSYVKLTIQTADPEPEEKAFFDFINRLEIYSQGQVDVDRLVQSSVTTLAVDSREAEIEAYSDGLNSWVKFPFETRYIVFSPELTPFDSGMWVSIQTQMLTLIRDVLTEFLKDFDYDSGTFTSLGQETITTADGPVRVEQIALVMDAAEARALAVAALKHVQENDALLEVLLDKFEDTALLSPEYGSMEDLYEGMSREEAHENLKEFIKGAVGEMAAGLESSELMADIGFDADLKFSVDGSGNLRQVAGEVNVLMTDMTNPVEKNIIGYTFTSTYSKFNALGDITLPTFSPGSTVDFQTWIESSGEDAARWFEEFSGIPIIKKNTVIFTQGSETVSINGQNVTLPAPTYIKNGCTMIPAGVFVHNDLGISSTAGRLPSGSWRIVMSYNTNNLVMETGSRTATANGSSITLNQAPEIKNGSIMVPLTQMAKHLEYTYTWDPATKRVTVNLTDYGF